MRKEGTGRGSDCEDDSGRGPHLQGPLGKEGEKEGPGVRQGHPKLNEDTVVVPVGSVGVVTQTGFDKSTRGSGRYGVYK